MMRNALTDFILEFGEKPYGTVDNKLACHRKYTRGLSICEGLKSLAPIE